MFLPQLKVITNALDTRDFIERHIHEAFTNDKINASMGGFEARTMEGSMVELGDPGVDVLLPPMQSFIASGRVKRFKTRSHDSYRAMRKQFDEAVRVEASASDDEGLVAGARLLDAEESRARKEAREHQMKIANIIKVNEAHILFFFHFIPMLRARNISFPWRARR